jgi:glycosyltransferase involved in cell wall biosynthesis
MRHRFPWTREKIETYVNAIPPADQEIFAGIRRERRERRSRQDRRDPTSPTPPGLRFLWIGRWVPQKGTRRFLRFLAERARTHPEDTFTLAGCGPQAERECPPELVASGRLRLLPGFSREALPQLLAEHDAGLFTSEVEGWGLSLNEMLESGLPVFATPAGGATELAPYFPLTLSPFPPPADLSLSGLAGPPEDLTKNGYFERFTWESIARSYEERVLSRLP